MKITEGQLRQIIREALDENKRSIESAQVERWARLAGLLVD